MKKAVVLVDEWNISKSAINLGKNIDWEILKGTIKTILEGEFSCDIIEFIIYIGTPPERMDYDSSRYGKNSFISFLETIGFLIKQRKGIPTSGSSYKADIDVMIAVDAFNDFSDADVFVIVSGDGDFSYVVKSLRENLKLAGVASTSNSLSSDLKNACSFFLELDDIIIELMPDVELKESK